ncbi:hypothetical protein [Polyangium jinanense]|uniref:CBM-cenC domain-containing protein n=1 Tax=Polyangium jinanense TaxID=2829994 RepID=A0A9X3XBH1_9BACT|nr:hypothetical protein [Polyangium jinanense]MDC3959997.1 hypothetical protein [Polyangium jinanense]MDC3986215.1 hypothetical protein [Polyangium jinanense]
MKSIQNIVRFGLTVLLAALPVACVAPEATDEDLYVVAEADDLDALATEEDDLASGDEGLLLPTACLTKRVTFDETTQAFTSGYTPVTGSLASGQFKTTTDATTCNGGFRGKSPNGNKFACYDGATTSSVNAACVSVPIAAGIAYRAQVYARSLSTQTSEANKPSLQFFVAGAACGTPKALAYNSVDTAWELVSCDFTRLSSSIVTICVQDLSTSGWANDFGLEDLRIAAKAGQQLGECIDGGGYHRECDGNGNCRTVALVDGEGA